MYTNDIIIFWKFLFNYVLLFGKLIYGFVLFLNLISIIIVVYI